MKIYKKLTEEELQQIPLEELADRVTPSWRIRPNVLELVRRAAEAEKDQNEWKDMANWQAGQKVAVEARLAQAENDRDLGRQSIVLLEKWLKEMRDERDRYLEQRRRLLVLAEYGYGMEFYAKYVDDPDWLTIEWLDRFYGEPQPDYVIAALKKK